MQGLFETSVLETLKYMKDFNYARLKNCENYYSAKAHIEETKMIIANMNVEKTPDKGVKKTRNFNKPEL